MNNLTPELTKAPAAKVTGKKKDVLPYRLHPIIDFLRGESSANDADLEMAIATVITAVRDGSLNKDVGQELLISLMTVFKRNDHVHDVTTLLREVDMEVAQREVERVEQVRRKGAVKP